MTGTNRMIVSILHAADVHARCLACRRWHQVAKTVHSMFSLLDSKCAMLGIEKIRTIGDGYLATAGVFRDYNRLHPTAACSEVLLEDKFKVRGD